MVVSKIDATSFENGCPTTRELTWNHPAKYPFIPSAGHLSRKGAFAKPRALVHLLCLTQLWTVFRLASKVAHKSHCTKVVPCEMHITHSPNAEQTNSIVVG
jgi:hypothetical protein